MSISYSLPLLLATLQIANDQSSVLAREINVFPSYPYYATGKGVVILAEQSSCGDISL